MRGGRTSTPKVSVAIGWNVELRIVGEVPATPMSTEPSATIARTCGERWSVARICTSGIVARQVAQERRQPLLGQHRHHRERDRAAFGLGELARFAQYAVVRDQQLVEDRQQSICASGVSRARRPFSNSLAPICRSRSRMAADTAACERNVPVAAARKLPELAVMTNCRIC